MISRLRDLIPEPALRRLPWYLAYVSLLRQRGVEYVSSTGISRGINVDASQIAKDLSFLEEFLGFRRRHNAAIVGVGSLGRALMSDSGLANYGLEIVAGFDVSPALIGTSTPQGLPIYDVAELATRARQLEVEIGIVTVPVEYAQEAADEIIAAGMKAIWNFTPYRIMAPDDVVISNTSIYAHLAVMYNRMLSK